MADGIAASDPELPFALRRGGPSLALLDKLEMGFPADLASRAQWCASFGMLFRSVVQNSL